MTKWIKRKSFMGAMLLTGALMLTGCGEEPYELQDNEREIIVNYAAHILAKYNVKQPEGYQYVYPQPEESEKTQEQEAKSEDTKEQQSDGDSTEQTQGNSSSDGKDESSVTLSEALGLKGVQAVYTGAELTDQYNSIIPNAGKKLLILHVTLQNQTNKARACDILSMLPVFRATVNGTQKTTAELSILPENLSTWEEKIPAGESADTIILFQVDADEVTSVDRLEMDVTAGGKTSRVVFL